MTHATRGVYDLLTADLLTADGFNVSVVQNQTLSLQSDVETTHNVLDLQDGPAILVGHSYGGAVITEAGRHERVAGLVYIAAFAPDAGESVNTLIADPPPGAPVPPILPPVDGFLFLDREKFAHSFAADLSAEDAAFMADSQVPWGVDALGGAISEPAWRSRPSWYLVASDDRMIPPPAQRFMSERAGSTVVEEGGSNGPATDASSSACTVTWARSWTNGESSKMSSPGARQRSGSLSMAPLQRSSNWTIISRWSRASPRSGAPSSGSAHSSGTSRFGFADAESRSARSTPSLSTCSSGSSASSKSSSGCCAHSWPTRG